MISHRDYQQGSEPALDSDNNPGWNPEGLLCVAIEGQVL